MASSSTWDTPDWWGAAWDHEPPAAFLDGWETKCVRCGDMAGEHTVEPPHRRLVGYPRTKVSCGGFLFVTQALVLHVRRELFEIERELR